MKKLVKSSHVDANTPLHVFAKQNMKILHSRKMKELKEALVCKVCQMNTDIYIYIVKSN
jgi:hypothetical protein